MFCYQCQETIKNQGCSMSVGACGKKAQTSDLQDLLIYTAKGVAAYAAQCCNESFDCTIKLGVSHYIQNALFITITNANFDDAVIAEEIRKGLKLRDRLKENLIAKGMTLNPVHEGQKYTTWHGNTMEELAEVAKSVGTLATENEDVRSLRSLLLFGLKGLAAYAQHADHLDKTDAEIFKFILEALLATENNELSGEELTGLVLKCGEFGVKTMALLDSANTTAFGHPEITEVNLGVGKNPGILITGHDLLDLKQLLEQSEGTGVDIYTHSEMLPGHYYPELKKYKHFVGNYGGSWWHQKDEFESFNGPIVFTTNCIVPPSEKATYNNRVFTTNAAGYPGWGRVEVKENGEKDFAKIIEMAKTMPAPKEIETGTIVGGFAHNQVLALADKVVDAVKSGAIKKFVVMAGCDGRNADRNYYTDFAEKLPSDTVILTAGCAKYRYNKLNLGDIGGIPRVLDAGQCNDSYSLAVIAMTLQKVFGLDDINELPIVYNIAWYEQKAVIVLLALLSLGVKNIHLGPSVPAFLSPNVLDVLVKNFGIQPGGIDVAKDLEKWNLN